MPKELPILFTGDMVSAILEDRKNMTRRLKGLSEINKRPNDYGMRIYSPGNIYAIFWDKESNNVGVSIKCPYGKPGDILYVKESFNVLDVWENDCTVQILYEGGTAEVCALNADEWVKFSKWEQSKRNGEVKVSSLFMFKSLSRIWLQIEDIRVERLQKICEEDAIKEGVKKHSDFGSTGYILYTEPDSAYTDIDAVWSFESLWQSINGPESWEENPYVWVISFNILSTTGKPENI